MSKHNTEKPIALGISARHIHLTQEHLDILFGEKDYKLTVKKELLGGEYASEEVVKVVSESGAEMDKVRILGPCRKASQVEISKTDSIKLKLNPPYRQSGDLAGSAPVKLVGPKGEVSLAEGCIIAKNHIHMSLDDAKELGVTDKELVDVRFAGERAGVFEGVLVRADARFRLEMHLDTDEANAFGLTNQSVGYIAK